MSRATDAAPIVVVTVVLLILWYAACLPMNRDVPQLAGLEGLMPRYAAAWSLDRPALPAPHQVLADLWKQTFGTSLTRDTEAGVAMNPRNLVYHAWVTLSATLLGFAGGALLGVALAAGIVENRVLRLSLMPWLVASQTIPILAIAPIIVVALGAAGITGLVPEAIISAYLSFFPVAVGMTKGLTSPDAIALDLMRTYSASPRETFTKLRWPASIPMLFASLKVSIAISLVGAIVAELPTGATAGLGARLLQGSYYGQTVQIWSALAMAVILATLLSAAVSAAEKVTLKAMGVRTAEAPP